MIRKYADRPLWKRVKEKEFQVKRINSATFTGNICYFHIIRVDEALSKDMGYGPFVIADDGYLYVQFFPEGEAYTLTTMLNDQLEVVEMYVDICKSHGLDERGVPWYDDLYLDIVILPTEEVFLVDEEELAEAKELSLITEEEYTFAREQAFRLLEDMGDFLSLWKSWMRKYHPAFHEKK